MHLHNNPATFFKSFGHYKNILLMWPKPFLTKKILVRVMSRSKEKARKKIVLSDSKTHFSNANSVFALAFVLLL